MMRTLWAGAGAGAAGTTALNATAYLDMAVRGRPSSSTPELVVQKLADKAGLDMPGQGETRKNRLDGLGPLSGIAVGVIVGVAAAVTHRVLSGRGRRLPAPVESAVLGAAAMALADVPMTLLDITHPSTWSAAEWASDVVPHLAYGAVTCACLRALEFHVT